MPASRFSAFLLLAFTGVAVFQTLVYLGLRSTIAVNAVLLNSSLELGGLEFRFVISLAGVLMLAPAITKTT